METIERIREIIKPVKTNKKNLKIRMAKGYTCPKCGYHMYAVYEDPQPNGKTRVSYQCRSCNHTLTVFE